MVKLSKSNPFRKYVEARVRESKMNLRQYAGRKGSQFKKGATIRRYQVELEGLNVADQRLHKRVETIRGEIARLRA